MDIKLLTPNKLFGDEYFPDKSKIILLAINLL